MSKQPHANILVYRGKHGDQFWLADTPERMDAAQRELFKQLDDLHCYSAYDRQLQRTLVHARDGDIQAIRSVLNSRNGCEYESWDIIAALIPSENLTPSAAAKCES